jgi:hypothetical protein
MMNIQKKSLEHISKTLKSYDTYETYSALIDIMTKEGIDNAVRNKITEVFQSTIREQSKKVDEAKAWTDSLLEDVK